MNSLPEEIDLSPFVGRQLVQLCFGAWNVAMLFDGPVRIVVESTVVIAYTNGHSQRIEEFRAGAEQLCSLIGQSVACASRSPAGGLTLQLSSGMQIEIEHSRSEYESFQIHIGEKTFVV